MGMGLIFPSLPERDEVESVSSLTGLGRLRTASGKQRRTNQLKVVASGKAND
jgi:hypothetical protein